MKNTATESRAQNGAGLIVPQVSVINGIPMTTSCDVAEYFGKQHRNVLKSVRNADCSADFRRLNFELSSYRNKQNKNQPMFHITKDGFVFVMMGFTGKQAARLKEAYIHKFNEMDEQLQVQGFLRDFDAKGKLPNDLRATCEMYALAEKKISAGQTYMRKLRRFRKRCGEHIIDLSTSPLPEPPNSSETKESL